MVAVVAAAEGGPLLVVIAGIIGQGRTLLCVSVSLMVVVVVLLLLLARGWRVRRRSRLSLFPVAIQLHDFAGGSPLGVVVPPCVQLLLLLFRPVLFTLCQRKIDRPPGAFDAVLM